MDAEYSSPIPIDPNVKYSVEMPTSTEDAIDTTESYPYRQAIGALLYATQCVRIDGCFAVSKLSRYMNCYTKAHWDGVMKLLRYFMGSRDMTISYDRNGENRNVLVGYVDSDWAADVDTRRSQTGYVFYLNGGPVSWQSKKQTTVALSTVEAEYMAMAAAAQEALYLRQLLVDLGFPQGQGTVLYEDNQAAMSLATGQASQIDIDIRHHFIREKIAAAQLVILRVPSAQQRADIWTKSFAVAKFRDLIGLVMGAEKDQYAQPAKRQRSNLSRTQPD